MSASVAASRSEEEEEDMVMLKVGIKVESGQGNSRDSRDFEEGGVG